ncbi:hypothetical protein BJ138DRAFT_590749 [Hygrophoropsis aurantiaca]|uniref:Uncharacterized protein n=1 Tax=Hygrophoropsis aurantiaca TaxID=72124 RepID=A0ACB8A265_9AGAM|nr:hypothetical protein BJ138DRAFT_590749 [Hygrophoropsis aurantiaca]
MSFHTVDKQPDSEWSTCSFSSVFRLGKSPNPSFNSPVVDKCGLKWQFSLNKKLNLSSQWVCKDIIEQAIVDVAVNLGEGRPLIVKRITLFPNSCVAHDITAFKSIEIKRVTSLSITVTVLQGSLEQHPLTLPHSSTSSPRCACSQAASDALHSSRFDALLTRPPVLQTLSQSLDSGSFFDTKFILCSRRKTSGNPGVTQRVYAQTDVLYAISPNLDLDEMFVREDKLFLNGNTLGERNQRMLEIVDEYEYESDSDLDEGESEGRDRDVEGTAEMIPSQSAEVVFEAIVKEQSGGGGKLDEGSSRLTAGAATVSEEGAPALEDTTSVSLPATSDFEDVWSEGSIQSDGQVRHRTSPLPNVQNVVYVKGTAYKTWRALIYYCYTGQITFSPLKSSQNAVEQFPNDERDNCCSPKSMYRLAHKLGIKALETSALAAVEKHLSKDNIFDEIFSNFTSKYTVIQEMEMKILLANRNQPEVVQALPRIIRGTVKKISQGSMPHAQTVLSDVMQKLIPCSLPASYIDCKCCGHRQHSIPPPSNAPESVKPRGNIWLYDL